MIEHEIEDIYEDTPAIPNELSDEAEIGNVPSIAELMPAYMRAFGKRLKVEDRGKWERVMLDAHSLQAPLSPAKKAQYAHPGMLEGAAGRYEARFLSTHAW